MLIAIGGTRTTAMPEVRLERLELEAVGVTSAICRTALGRVRAALLQARILFRITYEFNSVSSGFEQAPSIFYEKTVLVTGEHEKK